MDPDDIDIELRDVDEAIIAELEEGWRTRQYLADELGYSGEYIYQRVHRLIEHGVVEAIHDGFYRLAADGGAVTEEVPATVAQTRAELDQDIRERATQTDLRRVIKGVDSIPQRFDADDVEPVIEAVLERIRHDGGPTMRDLLADVMPQHSLGYDVPDDIYGERRPRVAWWRKIVRPVLQRVDAVEQRGDGSWVWTGD